jgi:hypothetical protein
MKTNSGTIELKNSTIVCDDWLQLLNNEWIRLTFCPHDLIPGSCEGFIRLVDDKKSNVIFFETNGNVEYISELYRKVYTNAIIYRTDYFCSDRAPYVTNLIDICDIFSAFVHLDRLLIQSDMLLPFI